LLLRFLLVLLFQISLTQKYALYAQKTNNYRSDTKNFVSCNNPKTLFIIFAIPTDTP